MKITILLVEDDEGVAGVIKTMGDLATARVIEWTLTPSLKTALVLDKSNKFDLIFLDLVLPDSSGDDSVTSIPQFRAPVVVMSGYSDLVEKAKRHGAMTALLKGETLTSKTLANVIQQALSLRQLKIPESQFINRMTSRFDLERIIFNGLVSSYLFWFHPKRSKKIIRILGNSAIIVQLAAVIYLLITYSQYTLRAQYRPSLQDQVLINTGRLVQIEKDKDQMFMTLQRLQNLIDDQGKVMNQIVNKQNLQDQEISAFRAGVWVVVSAVLMNTVALVFAIMLRRGHAQAEELKELKEFFEDRKRKDLT